MSAELRKDARELVAPVRRIWVGYTRHMSKELDKLGVSIPQYTALAILHDKGEVTMGVLADGLGVTMGAATNIMDKLSGADLASRERETADRRVVKVRITDKGRRMLEKVEETAADYLGFLLADLDATERNGVVRIFQNVALRIASAPYSAPDRQ